MFAPRSVVEMFVPAENVPSPSFANHTTRSAQVAGVVNTFDWNKRGGSWKKEAGAPLVTALVTLQTPGYTNGCHIYNTPSPAVELALPTVAERRRDHIEVTVVVDVGERDP